MKRDKRSSTRENRYGVKAYASIVSTCLTYLNNVVKLRFSERSYNNAKFQVMTPVISPARDKRFRLFKMQIKLERFAPGMLIIIYSMFTARAI